MKKIYYLLLAGIFFINPACEDILEEKPMAIAAETFYNTAEEIESALYGAYSQFSLGAFRRNYLCVNLSQVDYGVGRGSYSSTSNFQGLDPTNIGRTNGMWAAFYRSIRDVNIIIERAANASEINETRLAELLAEARFIRAYNYFQLVLNWGAVPLRTEENISDPDLPRTPVIEIYAQIVSDLQYAESNLPDVQAMAGRASKMVAKTVLADVYLNMGEWTEAKQKALEVINSGKYQLVPVSKPDDFYKIFGPDIVSTPEEIFYLKYNSEISESFVVMLHKSNRDYFYGNGAYAAYVPDSTQNKTIVEWDMNDLRRRFNLYNDNIGVGSRTLLYKKFIRPDVSLDPDYPIYRYADLLTIYAEADCMANGGPTPDGMEKLNMVHRRGYGYDPTQPSPVDFVAADYNEDTFIDLVLKERLYELFSEHKRFYDLKRTGKLKEVIKDVKGIDVADKHLLWPIPNSEYNYNKAIDEVNDQNPGY
jgi:starch-binding outer membrane protein, SusD/RagB family